MAQQSKLVGKDGAVVAQKGQIGPFGVVELAKSGTDAVYDDRNGKSTIAATFTLPLILVGGASVELTGRVYGRLQKDGTVGFEASAPKGITMSAEMRDSIKAHVQDAAIEWPGRKLAWSAAYDRLTAQPKPKGSKSAQRAEAMTFKPEATDTPETGETTAPAETAQNAA